MLRVDPFTTYAYCCRICQLEFFTVFFIVFEIPVANGQMQELYVYAAIWSTSVSLTKFLITVRTRLPLHFISSLHCAPLKRLFGILFFVAPSSRCLSD